MRWWCSLDTSLSISAFSIPFYSLIISHFCQEDYAFFICKPIKEKLLSLHLFAIVIKATIISETKTTSKLYFLHFIDTTSFNCQQIYDISIFPLLNGRAVTQNFSYSSHKNVSFRVASIMTMVPAAGLWNPSPLCTKAEFLRDVPCQWLGDTGLLWQLCSWTPNFVEIFRATLQSEPFLPFFSFCFTGGKPKSWSDNFLDVSWLSPIFSHRHYLGKL